MRPADAGRRSWALILVSRMGVLCRGRSDAVSGGPLGSPSSEEAEAGESQSTRQGCTASLHLQGPRAPLLPHTHLLCVSDCHTAGASHLGQPTTPSPPTCVQPFLCPRPASCTLSTPPSRPWHKRRCASSPPVSGPFPLPQLHSFNKTLTEHPPGPRLCSRS